MIQRLQRRMTALVLIALLLVEAGLVVSINVVNRSNLTQQAYAMLDILAQTGGERPIRFSLKGDRQNEALQERSVPPEDEETQNFGYPGRNPESEEVLPDLFEGNRMAEAVDFANTFMLTFDEEGTLKDWFSERSENYAEETIRSLAAQIYADGRETGKAGNCYYKRLKQNGGRTYIVLDRHLEAEAAERVLTITAAVAATAYLVLGVGAVLLIRRMVRPVNDAFEKQKQFVWDAGHELKTPLAVISANAQLLEEEAGASEPLEFIRQEVSRCDRLIGALLSLARMDRGTVQAQMATFNLSRAVESVVLPFESAVFEAGKHLETQIAPDLQNTGDGEMIRQMTLNLLSNALKYSNEGGTIRVTLNSKADRCILTVWNTGNPIPEADQKKIFDRFYRGDPSHNSQVPGTGLGLSIVKSIVTLHSGHIEVRSSAESGTAFVVTL